MKKTIAIATLCGVLGTLLALPATAHAGGRHHHSRASFGFHFGGPFYDPFWDPWPYYRPFPPAYYQPRTVIIEREPPVYVQRQPAPAPTQAQAPATIWYYCQSPAGYYPHVPRCNQQWIPVDPSTVPPR
jgi:hypothetical protein